MQNDSFSDRLAKALDINNMSQTELSKKTKLDKSLISNYLKGTYKAGQDNLKILAKTLGVSEPWLMGYDVPIIKEQENKFHLKNANQTKLDVLYSKARDKLSPDSAATMEFILQKTIEEYERSKNNNE